jgi:hypothetical protein
MATTRALVPACAATLPLDAGQAFAGPRFLVFEDHLALFEPGLPAQGGTTGPVWRLGAWERLPAAPPAVGLARARVKWRDGALWMKAGTRVFQRDAASGQRFLMADPGLEFRDFEVDLKGRVLLVATSDPASRRYRALLEAVGADKRATEVLQDYPDRDYQDWFRRLPPVTAATLLTGYESVQIQEFIVLYNPLARRVFIYRALDGTFREAELGLPTRGVRDLAGPGAAGSHPSGDPPKDLCWQVLPRSDAEAWVVVPGGTGTQGEDTGTPQAIVLDLTEGRGGDPAPLTGCRLPVFPDPQGRLADLAKALEAYRTRGPGHPKQEAGTGRGTAVDGHAGQ